MIAACITAKNEAETIGPLIETLVKQELFPIVVNDGSTDGTGAIALDAGAAVLWHKPSRGIGPSLLAAWAVANRADAEMVVQLDAGGSHDPLQARRLLAALQHADVVIGSRFVPGGPYASGLLPGGLYWGNPTRERLSRLASRMCNLITGEHIADWTSGYRAFRREALEKLLQYEYRARMHGWQIEVLGNALREGLRIAEVPISYEAGRSSFNMGVAWEALGAWLRLI